MVTRQCPSIPKDFLDLSIKMEGGYYIIKAKPKPQSEQKPSKSGKTITVFATGGMVWDETPDENGQSVGVHLTIGLSLPKDGCINKEA
jgi:hypothetical protein